MRWFDRNPKLSSMKVHGQRVNVDDTDAAKSCPPSFQGVISCTHEWLAWSATMFASIT